MAQGRAQALGSIKLVALWFSCGLAFVGDAFSVNPWLPWPLLGVAVAIGAVLFYFVVSGKALLSPAFFGVGYLLLAIFAVTLVFGVLLAPAPPAKSFNHAFGYLVVIGTFGFGLRFVFSFVLREPEDLNRAYTLLGWGALIGSTIAILEFVDRNFLHAGLTGFVRFAGETEPYKPLFLNFYRSRGLFLESAFLAMSLNASVPVVVACWWGAGKRMSATLLVLLSSLALLLSFSVGGMLSLAAGLAISFGFDAVRRGLRLRHLSVVTLIATLAAAFVVALPEPARAVLLGKVTLTSGVSAESRRDLWLAAIERIADGSVFGTGVGATSAATGGGVVSWFLVLLVEAGPLAVIAFAVLVYHSLLDLYAAGVSRATRLALQSSIVAVTVHYALVPNIWYPWFWLLCALAAAERHVASLRRSRDATELPE